MTADAEVEPEAPTLLDFSVDVAALATAMTRVKPAVSTRSGMPIGRAVKLTATNFGVKLTATDLDLALISRVLFNGVGQTHTEGELCVEHAMLTKFLAKAKGKGELRVTANGDEVTLSVGKIKVRLRVLPIEDFPVVKNPNDRSIELNADALGDVLIAASTDDARPVLTGIAVEHGTTYAATDSYRLHVVETGTEDKTIPTILVPRRVAVLLSKIGGVHPTTVSDDGYWAKIVTPDLKFVCRLVEGEYPKWRTLMPTSKNPVVTFRNEAFAAALEEIISMGGAFTTVGQTSASAVRITQADPDTLLLQLKHYEASVEITTPGHLLNSVQMLGFNPLYLRDLLKGTTSHEMIGLDHLKPVLITEQTDMGLRIRLIMPINIT